MTHPKQLRGGDPQDAPAAACTLRRRPEGALEVVAISPALVDLLGLGEGDWVGAPASGLLPAELVERAERVAGGGAPCQVEIRVGEGAGDRWLTAIVAPGADGTVVCALVDVGGAMSQRVEMERRLSGRQRLESLGMLAGGVAHDFNNLLQTVLGTSSMVRRHLPADAPSHADLEQIENACLQASDLCRQLLTYAGQQSSATELVDVEDIVAESRPLLQLSLSKKIALDFQPRGGVLPVLADASQLRQVLMNLVINASEAIGNAPGRISVAVDLVRGDDPCFDDTYVAPEDRAPEYVRLRVSDDGCGMDEETVARIFEPFYSTKFTGRGLGLAATLGIVRGHHGAIGVRSAPTEGTTFEVLLPATEGRPSRSIIPVGAADWTADATLLVVDDQDAVRHTAARMAEEVGFRTLLARDGLEALEVLELHGGRVDAVLLDLTMPRLDGTETLARVREKYADMPVILMSGYTEEDVADLTRQGMTAFLPKPFRPAQLVETLRRALDSR